MKNLIKGNLYTIKTIHPLIRLWEIKEGEPIHARVFKPNPNNKTLNNFLFVDLYKRDEPEIYDSQTFYCFLYNKQFLYLQTIDTDYEIIEQI